MSAPIEMLGLVNLEAERAVLFAMRTETNAAISLAEQLAPGDFHDQRHGIVFEAIRSVLLGIEPVDTSAIVAECKALLHERKLKAVIDHVYIESLTAEDVRRAQMYGHTVKRLAWLRGAGEFAFWLTNELTTRPDPDHLFVEAQERWQVLSPKHGDTRFMYGWDTMKAHQDQMRQRIQEREEGVVTGFDWPWSTWNKRIRPLRAGFVGILAAPDGMGKTTYLEMVAEHWASKGQNVIYVHLEDELGYKLDRRLARHALVPIDHIEDGIISADDKRRIVDAEDRMAGWAGLLHYYDAAGASMADIIRELESRVAEGVCEAVVFDYLDKVQPTRAQAQLYGSNSWERQANDMEQLKTFAERSHVPIMTATQGNKSMQGEGIQTRKAIQGSGQKSQKAQLVVILTRDIVGESGLRDANGKVIAEAGEYSPVAKIRIDKQNRGKTGDFQQVIVGQYFAVRDTQKD